MTSDLISILWFAFILIGLICVGVVAYGIFQLKQFFKQLEVEEGNE